jgi:SOS-response transcriptional repressor LexA
VRRSKPTGLYAIKADGSSMNRAEIDGKRIEDGDFMIVDKNDKNVSTGDKTFRVARQAGPDIWRC